MKINVTIHRGDSEFLLSVIVKPNNVGSGIPTTLTTGGAGNVNVTTPSGAFPFTIVARGENYDIPEVIQ